jgi:hypothetical protein
MRNATATASKKGALPSLSTGRLTPEVAATWIRLSKAYFREKKIDAADRVEHIAGSFEDSSHIEWYEAREPHYNAMDFNDFADAFKLKFLSERAAIEVQTELYQSRQGDRDFLEWAMDIRRLNRLIEGSSAHQNDAQLSHHIRANCETELRQILGLHSFRADPSSDLEGWLDEAQTLYKRLQAERDRTTRQAEALYKRRATTRPESTASTQNRHQNRPQNTAPTSSSSTGPRPSGSGRIPRMTEEERSLLFDNQGCLKCRRVFAGHFSKDCPNGFPTKHVLVTQALVDRYRPKAKTEATPPYEKPVATATTEPVPRTDAAGAPSDSEEYVPSTMPLYTVNFLVSNRPCPTLIDNGSSHSAIVDRELVDRLGLICHPFRTPRKIGTADADRDMEVEGWVRLGVESQDRKWKSRTMRAKVVRKLCRPIILGVPFLRSHKMIHDYEADTLIDPKDGYNVLKDRDNNPEARTVKVESKKERRKRTEEPESALTYVSIVPKQQRWTAGYNVSLAMRQIRHRIEELANQEELGRREDRLREEFRDRFPLRLPDVPDLPTDVYHRIRLKDANKTIAARQYQSPRKYREAWKRILQEHLDAGRLRPSSSAYASPAFLVPRTDPNAEPRLVIDYRELNKNTIRDRTNFPRIDEILADVGKGKIFGKIDMTMAFHQTRVHPDDIHLTAMTTPLGLLEWTVMPMGGTNAPATHQRRMYHALRHLIGKICHVYLDDIIIWSQTLDEHEHNIRAVMEALRAAALHCSIKKTQLFANRLEFLGHIISAEGIQADPSKTNRLAEWPIPEKAKDVRAFLGLLRFVAAFLPQVAEHTATLTPLTTKEAQRAFPKWTTEHQKAFDSIKTMVLGTDCLTTIDYDLPEHHIFVTTDASEVRVGAVLSFGRTWETARPVEFLSRQLHAAEKNYPTHEKEELAIVHALKKWRHHLMGAPFHVYTDHRTLQYLETQKDLSRRQIRWAEYLSQYDYELHYVKGEDNTVADALSRLPESDAPEETPEESDDLPGVLAATRALTWEPEEIDMTDPLPRTDAGGTDDSLLRTDAGESTGTVMRIEVDPLLLGAIRTGYEEDSWCRKLKETKEETLGITERDGLLFVGNRLIIPRNRDVREHLYQAAHDAMGHFGFDKSYATLRDSYYWPGMRSDLENAYIPSCSRCQRNKSRTKALAGPMHPLPIPEQRGDSVAIDFIGPLPKDSGYDCIVTMTDRLGGSDIRIEPTTINTTAEEFALLFFNKWYCENGLPLEIVSDRDKLFTSKFWKALNRLTGVKLKMSTSYHPETDGASERTNKTVNQILRYHVDRSQTGWVKALPHVRFMIMNTVNKSTGYSPFQIRMGRSPRILPPLVPDIARTESKTTEGFRAVELFQQLEENVMDAQDALLAAKINQAYYANDRRAPEVEYKKGDMVLMSTENRRRTYKSKGDGRVAKFMPRFDGPYEIVEGHPETSTYTLKLPFSDVKQDGFHGRLLRPWRPNNPDLFPDRQLPEPGPTLNEQGEPEWEVEEIIERRRRGKGFQYLVRYRGYGPEDDRWLPGSEVEELEAMDRWLEKTEGREKVLEAGGV